jgi:hypothetical protein
VSYDSWYEWFPDYANDFSDISFSAGDSVTVTVVASSATTGTAKITNNSNGQSGEHIAPCFTLIELVLTSVCSIGVTDRSLGVRCALPSGRRMDC